MLSWRQVYGNMPGRIITFRAPIDDVEGDYRGTISEVRFGDRFVIINLDELLVSRDGVDIGRPVDMTTLLAKPNERLREDGDGRLLASIMFSFHYYEATISPGENVATV